MTLDAGDGPAQDLRPGLAARVARRWRHNLVRAARAARHGGPGRLAGLVLDARLAGADVVITGWAATPAAPVVAVIVTIDGRPGPAATLHEATPVLGHRDPATHRSATAGWSARVPRAEVPSGPVRFGALVVRGDELIDEAVPLLTALPAPDPPPTTDLDAPAAGEVLTPAVAMVHGWAIADDLDRIEVTLGDGPAHRASILSHVRPDISSAFPDAPIARIAGWSVLVDVPDVADAQRMPLAVDVVSGGRRSRLPEREVTVEPRPRDEADDQDRVAQLAARVGVATGKHLGAKEGVSLLVATHHLGLGGGQLYLQELLRHLLRAEDVSCTVLTSADGPLRDELEELGARIHVVGDVPSDACAYEARMLELVALSAQPPPNVVLANTMGSFWAVDLATRLDVPAIWAVHESFTIEQFSVVAFHRAIDDHVRSRLSAAFADAAAVVFEADTTAALFASTITEGRSIRIDYGVDLEAITAHRSSHDRTELRAAHGLDPDEIVLVCVATFGPRKAQGSLCVAFARVADRYPSARLVLVGDSGGPYSEAVRGLVAELDIEDRVTIVPVTADIYPWYQLADGFVLASDVESLPRSMLEVMAFDVPVLASAVFGVPELITDGVDGLLFEPRCLASLASALDRFLSLDPAARQDLGRRGGARVNPSRSSRWYAEAYRSLLTGLIDDPTARPATILEAAGW